MSDFPPPQWDHFKHLHLNANLCPTFSFLTQFFPLLISRLFVILPFSLQLTLSHLLRSLLIHPFFFSCQDRSTTMILFSYTFIIYMMLKLDNVSIASNLLHQFLKYFYQYYKALSSERSRFTFFIFVNKYIGNGYINCSY